MECHTGHLYDMDKPYFPTFLNIIKPFIFDPNRYERLQQEFPPPRAITLGPCPPPPGYKDPLSLALHSPPAQTVPRPTTGLKVVLQRIEIPQG